MSWGFPMLYHFKSSPRNLRSGDTFHAVRYSHKGPTLSLCGRSAEKWVTCDLRADRLRPRDMCERCKFIARVTA